MTEHTARPRARFLTRTVAVAAVLAALTLGALTPAEAQAPPATEKQALAIERQLMCPVCPNERLDTSQNRVARDMKRIIREQLAQGRTPDDIILYFESRYGPIVRADFEAEGFNLLLFGWVGGSIVAGGAAAAWYLWTLRRRSRSAAVNVPSALAADEVWLDEALAAAQGDGDDPPVHR